MTKARIQPFCRANNISIGYSDGERIFPRSVTNRNTALFLYNNHFCLIWKSQNISFDQAVIELKKDFKIVNNYITHENVKSYFEYKYQPKKLQSCLSNFIVYDLGTLNTDIAKPYTITFYRLYKIAGRWERDPTEDELNKSKKYAIAFVGENCVGTTLDFCLKIKREEYKGKKSKVLEYIRQLHAHNEVGFDTWIVLKNLPCDKRIVNIIKNGKGIIELKVFNGYNEKLKNKIHTTFILDVA